MKKTFKFSFMYQSKIQFELEQSGLCVDHVLFHGSSKRQTLGD